MPEQQLEFFETVTGQHISTEATELAPDTWLIVNSHLIPAEALPRYGIFEYVRQPDGSFRLVARTQGAMLKLTQDIGSRLGFREINRERTYRTIKRLCWAGFIKCQRLTHDVYYLDLHSLFKFLKAVQNPGFWTPERIAIYLEARDGPLPDPDGSHWNPPVF